MHDNIIELSHNTIKKLDLKKESELFLQVVNSSKKEGDIQKYIKENEKWFIPGSIILDYDFGKEISYVIPELPLGSEYQVDYMLAGYNSLGPQIILVEFENANVDYKNKTSNSETRYVSKGITQIRDWKRWIERNYKYLSESKLHFLGNNIRICNFYYCLVVCRRAKMDDVSNNMRTQLENELNHFHIITYDRIIDNIKLLYK